jgi:hypothetical protein
VASASTFQDARKTQINVLANRRNLIANPGFESATTNWSTVGTSVTVTTTTTAANVLYGSSAASVTNTSSGTSGISAPFTHDIKTSYRASAYVKNSSGADKTAYIEVTWADSTVSTGASSVVSTTSGWVRLDSGALTSPASSAGTATMKIVTGSSQAGTMCVDGVLVEPVSTLGAYFSGSYDGQNYAVNGPIDSMWEGATDNSISHLYYDRVFSAGKLDSMIVDGAYYA